MALRPAEVQLLVEEGVMPLLALVAQPGGVLLDDAKRSGDLEIDGVLADEGIVAGLVGDVPFVQGHAIAITPGEERCGFDVLAAAEVCHHYWHMPRTDVQHFSRLAALVTEWINGHLRYFRDRRMVVAVVVAVHQRTRHRDLELGVFREAHAHRVADAILQ